MRQYHSIKKQYPGVILLFRVGDFYETFENDAALVSEALGIVLTKRANGQAADVPLAGFPYHALETYLAKLVKKGFRVAVCDQTENPKYARGVVKRNVVEVATPGVNFNESTLEDRKNNYLCAISFENEKKKNGAIGLAFIDVTTAEFEVVETKRDLLYDLLRTIEPSEILISRSAKEEGAKIAAILKKQPFFTYRDEWMFNHDYAEQTLLTHFKTHSLKGFGIESLETATIAAGTIIHYLNETQKEKVAHIKSISKYKTEHVLSIDDQTKKNLEIFTPLIYSQNKNAKTTLHQVLDYTITPMGTRLFYRWMLSPLCQVERILERQSAVEELFKNRPLRDSLRASFKNMIDLDRMLSRIVTKRATPRQVLAFGKALDTITNIEEIASQLKTPFLIQEGVKKLKNLKEVAKAIDQAISEDISSTSGKYGIIKKGFSQDLDKIRSISSSSKDKLLDIQTREREKTGISSLKVQYNKVFGYYLEISNTHKNKVPSFYERKQTITNAERYTIPELKNYEEKILDAEEKVLKMEEELFLKLLEHISSFQNDILSTSQGIALLDSTTSLSEVAERFNYVKPVISDSHEIAITDGRHPVLERQAPVGEAYIPNHTLLNEKQRVMLITGPNMAGKSSYLRQIALITFLAQMGSYVPAKQAVIGIVDKIFTRVGASDNLAQGESTFLVEMNETANILNNATHKSLVLLDEVGRGTSTYDGLSLAWAITEYIHNVIKAKVLFATHYHELTMLKNQLEGLECYAARVDQDGEKLVFVRKIEKGQAKRSYGIEVAKMAGLPETVITRATDILHTLEEDERFSATRAKQKVSDIEKASSKWQLSLFEQGNQKIKKALENIEVDKITPIEAMLELVKLKKMIDNQDDLLN